MKAQRALNHEARAFTRQALEGAGYKVLPSEANFLMVDVRRRRGTSSRRSVSRSAWGRTPFPPLTTLSRISIGTPDQMRRAMAAILPMLGAPASAEARKIAHSGALSMWQPGVC